MDDDRDRTTHDPAVDAEEEQRFRMLADNHGIVSAWEYADYDGNGAREAFAVITDDKLDIIETLFISNNGGVIVMEDDINLMLYTTYDDRYIHYVGEKGFFFADVGDGGSGWKTLLYSVKDGIPYILALSSKIQGFYQDGDTFITTENELLPEGGHLYPKVELIYDSFFQEFIKGERIVDEPVSTDTWVTVRFEYWSIWNEKNDKEYGVFVATDQSDKELWRYTTVDHRHTELKGFGEIGIENGMYYLYDDNHVIALDLQTGSEIWRCPFTGGNASFDFDDAGTLYICGYYGPDLVVIDKEGEQLKQIERFDTGYYWADEINCQQDKIIVKLSGGPDGYWEKRYICVVNLPEYSYEVPKYATENEENP